MTDHDPRAARRAFLCGAAALPLGAACATSATEGGVADERARLDELFSDLRDQSASVAPITAREREARRRRMGAALAEAGRDALLCEGGATMQWLTGVSWGLSERVFLLIVLADGSHAWLSPAFEAEKARLRIEGPELPGGTIATWDEHEYAFEPLAALLRSHGVESVALDPQVRWFVGARLSETFGKERVHDGAALVAGLRSVKDA